MRLTFLQAITMGFLQGVAELFPVSSLGHTVLVPALVGGSWMALVTQESSPESPYLAFVVGLHVATALALLVYFWRDWWRIIRGLVRSLWRLRIDNSDERLAWLLVVATVPVGITGLLAEHPLRVLFAKPVAAAAFLVVNGFILGGAEWLRRRVARRAALAAAAVPPQPATVPSGPGEARSAVSALPVKEPTAPGEPPARAIGSLRFWEGGFIGVLQIGALCAGISRAGISMAGGLLRGLDHEDAARFAFLLATPVILAAGVLKLPDLFGSLGNGIRGQVLAGSAVAAVMAYLCVAFLTRYFRTRTLTPFALYCVAFGAACLVYFG